MEKNLEKNRIPPIYQGVPFDSFDLYQHYSYGNGEALNLSSVGLSNKIRPLVNKDKAFGKSNGSIESRFISQYKNEGRTSFSNAYDFTKEASGIADPLWALGTATISGELKDIQIFPGGIAREISIIVSGTDSLTHLIHSILLKENGTQMEHLILFKIAG